MDIEEFYAADERRRASEEIEFGRDWHDAGGTRYELSWVADTGELYVMREPVAEVVEDPFGDVLPSSLRTDQVTVGLLGVVADRDELERVLAGWQDAMGRPDSVSWVVERLHESGVRERRG